MALRTLLIDDVADLRSLLRTMLRRDGRFEIVGEGATGEQAIVLSAKLQPDVVVLDIGMPDLDGITALPSIMEASPATRIVVLSGFPKGEFEPAALRSGAVGYIEKTADLDGFADGLHSLVAVLETVQRVLDETYAIDLRSPHAARLDLRAALEHAGSATSLDVIELLTSELVTNAVVHARSGARVAAEIHGKRIRVGVTDDGPGVPTMSMAPQDEEHGRGLALVDALAASWGVDRLTGGKTVWFEVDV